MSWTFYIALLCVFVIILSLVSLMLNKPKSKQVHGAFLSEQEKKYFVFIEKAFRDTSYWVFPNVMANKIVIANPALSKQELYYIKKLLQQHCFFVGIFRKQDFSLAILFSIFNEALETDQDYQLVLRLLQENKIKLLKLNPLLFDESSSSHIIQKIRDLFEKESGELLSFTQDFNECEENKKAIASIKTIGNDVVEDNEDLHAQPLVPIYREVNTVPREEASGKSMFQKFTPDELEKIAQETQDDQQEVMKYILEEEKKMKEGLMFSMHNQKVDLITGDRSKEMQSHQSANKMKTAKHNMQDTFF